MPIVVVTVNRAPMVLPALLLTIVIAVYALTLYVKLLPAMMAFKTVMRPPLIVVAAVLRVAQMDLAA